MLLAQAQGVESIVPSLMMFAFIGLAFYFMILKPQKKQAQKMKETMEGVRVGDHVITRAGVRGVVVKLKGDSFILETSPQKTQIEYLKQAISYIEANETVSEDNPFSNTPIGDLSYGNDSRFIEAVNTAKDSLETNKEFDILLEDVFEYIVVDSVSNKSDIERTFRLDSQRVSTIVNELVELKLIETNENSEIKVLLDPRN